MVIKIKVYTVFKKHFMMDNHLISLLCRKSLSWITFKSQLYTTTAITIIHIMVSYEKKKKLYTPYFNIIFY